MQLQVRKDNITRTRIVDESNRDIEDDEIRVRVDRFGYSANNVTYAAAGDVLGYWKFFPVQDVEWGLVPVWGFANVEQSNCDSISVGERLFGYFPPAASLIMSPIKLAQGHLIDGAAHRKELPAGYNLYRRVEEKNRDAEDRHMLLFPLYVTSWCLWDALQESDWFGAKQIVLASASSKTAIGTAFALAQDKSSPPVIGLTSKRNMKFVTELGLYDNVIAYDDLETLDPSIPTAIVDMSGNATMLGQLHTHLGSQMRQTLDVGLTHWEAPRRDDARNKENSTFFFAPAHIQSRIQQWGAEVFEQRTSDFMKAAIADSSRWMTLVPVSGLEALAEIHTDIATGSGDPTSGFVIEV